MKSESKMYAARVIGTSIITDSIRPSSRRASISVNANFNPLFHEVVEVELQVVQGTDPVQRSSYMDLKTSMKYIDILPKDPWRVGEIVTKYHPDHNSAAAVDMVMVAEPNQARAFKMVYDTKDKKHKNPIRAYQVVVLRRPDGVTFEVPVTERNTYTPHIPWNGTLSNALSEMFRATAWVNV